MTCIAGTWRRPSGRRAFFCALKTTALATSSLRALAVGTALGLTALPQAAAANSTKWSPWIEFGGYYSSEASRGEAALFAPLRQDPERLLFLDVRGKLFEESVNEGNFALGYRQMLSGWNLGLWAGYDRRRTSNANVFNQVSAGFEALSPDWDVRANAYLPIETEELVSETSLSTGGTQFAIIGGNLVMTTGGFQSLTRTTEIAPRGFDAEAGMRVPLMQSSLDQELRLYAGGFYFDNDLLDKAIAGPKARAEWRLNDIVASLPGSRLTVEAEIRDDDVRGTDWEVGARLRIPFGVDRAYAKLDAQERRMMDAIERDTDIVTETRTVTTSSGPKTTENVEDALTGVDFERAVTVNGTGDIQNTVTTAGANSLIIASGTFNTATMVNLSADQTVLGAGGTIAVRGLTSGKVANFTASGSTPTYNFTGTTVSEAAFSLAANNHVSGLNMVGDPGMSQQNNAFKFAASNTPNVYLTNLDLHNFYGGFLRNRTFDGTNVSNVELNMDRVTAYNDNRGGSVQSVVLFGDNNLVNITNSSFTNIRQGLEFTGDGNTVNFDQVSIAATNINIGAIAVRGATAGGVSTLTVTNSSFEDLAGAAISTDTGTVNVTFANSTINGGSSTPFGVLIATGGSTWSMNDVTFSGPINTGIGFYGTNNILSGTGNVSTAVHGNALCDTNGNAQIGSFGFTSPAVTCP